MWKRVRKAVEASTTAPADGSGAPVGSVPRAPASGSAVGHEGGDDITACRVRRQTRSLALAVLIRTGALARLASGSSRSHPALRSPDQLRPTAAIRNRPQSAPTNPGPPRSAAINGSGLHRRANGWIKARRSDQYRERQRAGPPWDTRASREHRGASPTHTISPMSCTLTDSPSAICLVPSGTTTRPFAATIDESTPDPCALFVSATSRPSRQAITAR